MPTLSFSRDYQGLFLSDMGSSAVVVELESQKHATDDSPCLRLPSRPTSISHGTPEPSHTSTPDDTDTPAAAVSALEKWNSPPANIDRTLATFWSFLVMGLNDAAYGVSSTSWWFPRLMPQPTAR